jgi:hypothetical protein
VLFFFFRWTSFAGTIPLIIVFLLTNVALPFYVKRNHSASFSIIRHAIIPIFSAVLMIVPIVGNFWPTPLEPPKNIFLYILIGWAAVGVVVVLIMRRIPGAMEKMGSAFGVTSAEKSVAIQ